MKHLGSNDPIPDEAIRIPEEVIEVLKKHCLAHGYGMVSMGNQELLVLLIGGPDVGPNEAAVKGCHIILSGIINGFMESATREGVQEFPPDTPSIKH